MIKFFTGLVRDFLDIYVDEEKIRDSYGDEYADRFAAVDPVTGKKMVSPLKIFTRIVIVLISSLCLFFLVRIITTLY